MSFTLQIPLLPTILSTTQPPTRRDDFADSRGVGLMPAATLVLWLGCLVVGIIGILSPDNSAPPPTTQPQSDQIEAIEVEVTKEPALPSVNPSPPQSAQTFAAPAPEAPQLAALQPPTAFAQLAQMPLRPVNNLRTVAPVRNITFGEGEGRQPEPDYPEEARLAGQQGTVTILFNVARDGQVLGADAVAPCPWPILNQAALRAIRQTWRFGPGPLRSYLISIQFQLREP
jgi:protein TonB